MKFIYFIDTDSKDRVLKDGITLKSNYRHINQESTGIFCYPLIKIPFKTPVLEKDYEDINDFLDFKKEEELLNTSLSIEESWEVIGASRVTRREPKVEKVSVAIFELTEDHWPLTVFINIRDSIGNKLAQLLENNPKEGIVFEGYENNLLKLVEIIQTERYEIASAPFTVHAENDLISLIDKLTLAGGGLWKEDSFECMLTENIAANNIEKVIELKNKYNNSIAK